MFVPPSRIWFCNSFLNAFEVHAGRQHKAYRDHKPIGTIFVNGVLDISATGTIQILMSHVSNVLVHPRIYKDIPATASVPHQRLLQKISSFWIHGKILKWTIRILCWIESSKLYSMVTSLILFQGTAGLCIGPRPLYHDIPSIVSSPVYLFADDAKVFRVIKSRDDYFKCSPERSTLTYSTTGPLLGNCHLIYWSGPPHHFEPYHINSLVIDSVTSHKDLGIQFDDQLKLAIVQLKSVQRPTEFLRSFSNSWMYIWCQSYLQL